MLKTLKEIETDRDKFWLSAKSDDLRQEAIEWIREIKKQNKVTEEELNEVGWIKWDECFDFSEDHRTVAEQVRFIIEFIKHLYNILQL